MDKINNDEIKKAISKYEEEEHFTALDPDESNLLGNSSGSINQSASDGSSGGKNKVNNTNNKGKGFFGGLIKFKNNNNLNNLNNSNNSNNSNNKFKNNTKINKKQISKKQGSKTNVVDSGSIGFSELSDLQLDNRMEESIDEGSYTPSSSFRQFIQENKPSSHGWYEKACQFSGNLMKISPNEKDVPKLKKALDTCHLSVKPEDTFSFAIIAPLVYMLLGLLFAFVVMQADLMFVSFFLLSGIGAMIPLTKLPFMMANHWRMKSSSEIVLAVFYMVTYMRQNSNLEKAVEFAADHLTGPLSFELKKVLWDIESEDYDTIKESLDNYLEKWRETNGEFIEAMNLLESSLYESNDESRIALLDKSLDVILSETYEKMLHYTHDIQSPISTLHMMGVILPILGLVILPLVVSFMEGVAWYHISILYNVLVPVVVFFVGKSILSSRPGGYGNSDMDVYIKATEKENKSFFSSPLFIALCVAIPLFLIGISPMLLHIALGGGENDVFIGRNELLGKPGIPVLDYREGVDAQGNTVYRGPFGMISTVLGIFIILSIGLGTGLYYKFKTKDLIKIREDTKKLEDGFSSAIFQLGNRLGDGIPLELAFSKVVDVMRDSTPGKFFSLVDQNIRRLGMSPEQALFDDNSGALVAYPSNLIRSTMKVLTESIKKGPMVASRAMTNVARYVKEMHSVEERLKDLLAEVVSSMTSLIRFLAPVISGIVVGITSMITNIIGTLSSAIEKMGQGTGGQAGAMAGLTSMFGDGISSYSFQIVVGLYIVQVVFIISKTITGISEGDDKLSEQYNTGKYLISSTILYCLMAAIIIIIFNTIAMSILGKAINADVI